MFTFFGNLLSALSEKGIIKITEYIVNGQKSLIQSKCYESPYSCAREKIHKPDKWTTVVKPIMLRFGPEKTAQNQELHHSALETRPGQYFFPL